MMSPVTSTNFRGIAPIADSRTLEPSGSTSGKTLRFGDISDPTACLAERPILRGLSHFVSTRECPVSSPGTRFQRYGTHSEGPTGTDRRPEGAASDDRAVRSDRNGQATPHDGALRRVGSGGWKGGPLGSGPPARSRGPAGHRDQRLRSSRAWAIPGAGRPHSLAVTRASATSCRQRNAGRVRPNSSRTVL